MVYKLLILNNGRGANRGDNAISQAQIAGLRDKLGDIEITHYAATPSSADPFKFLLAVRRCDLVIVGGGQMLRDDTSRLVLPILAYRVLAAKLFGKKVMFYGVGAGPITGRLSAFIVRWIIGRADAITVRDPHSCQLLEKLGVSKQKLQTTADPALAFEPALPARVDEVLRELHLTGERIVAITPRRAFYFKRRWLPHKYRAAMGLDRDGQAEQVQAETALACLADHLVERHGYKVLFIAMTPSLGKNREGENDDTVAKRIMAQSRHGADLRLMDGRYSAADIKGVLGRTDLLLAMRMHSTIFAAMQQTPVAAAGINVKFYHFFERLGLSDNIIPTDIFLDFALLREKIDGLLRDSHAIRLKLQQHTPQLLAEEGKNSDTAKLLLQV